MEQNTPVPMSGYKPFQKREGDERGKKLEQIFELHKREIVNG